MGWGEGSGLGCRRWPVRCMGPVKLEELRVAALHGPADTEWHCPRFVDMGAGPGAGVHVQQVVPRPSC